MAVLILSSNYMTFFGIAGIILYDQEVLMTFANLKKESPGISVRAFIATLTTLSMEQGRVNTI